MRNNHYAPQFILRHYGDRISCYNAAKRQFLYNKEPGSVFSEMGFYPDEIESDLSRKAESSFGPILNKIVETKGPITFTRKEVLEIKRFLLINKLRTEDSLFMIKENKQYLREEFTRNPDPVVRTMGRFIHELFSDESAEDYWRRSISFILNEPTGEFKNQCESEDATFYALYYSEAFLGGYITIWDAPEDEEFVISDSGMAAEDERPPNDLNNPLKLRMSEDLLKVCESNATECIRRIEYITSICKRFRENFFFFPISSKRLLVLVNPYFKLIHEIIESELPNKFIDLLSTYKQLKLEPLFERITMFSRHELTEPNRFNYKNHDPNEHRFTYRPVTLTSKELHYINCHIIQNTVEWFGFSNLVAVKPTFDYIKDKMPSDGVDPFVELYDILDHVEDETYLRNASNNDLSGRIRDYVIPDDYKRFIGSNIARVSIKNLIDEQDYESLIAILSLARLNLTELGIGCDEDSIIDVLNNVELDSEKLKSLSYEYESGQFSTNAKEIISRIVIRS